MKKSNKLTVYIVIAMVAGAILGYFIHESKDQATIDAFAKNIKLLTTIFLRLVQMIIAPLVFTTLVVGIAKLGDLKTVGRVGGKALRATAVNRTGARLMGISTHSSGQLTFTMAALLGALSGLLIGPTTTVFYDSGFLIGLKGFVAAVAAGLSSYPGALIAAMGVGVIESFGSFWASAFKEVIVFTLILPVLLYRSLRSKHSD